MKMLASSLLAFGHNPRNMLAPLQLQFQADFSHAVDLLVVSAMPSVRQEARACCSEYTQVFVPRAPLCCFYALPHPCLCTGPFSVLLLAFLRGLGDPTVSKHSLRVLQHCLQEHPRAAERTHGTLVYDLIFFSSLDPLVKVDHVSSYLRAFWSGAISWETLALWQKFLQIECYVDFACPVLSVALYGGNHSPVSRRP